MSGNFDSEKVYQDDSIKIYFFLKRPKYYTHIQNHILWHIVAL